MKEFSAKTMKIFHECWIFHALFVTIESRYIIVAKGDGNHCWNWKMKMAKTSFLNGEFSLERNFERKMKRYHCTIVQSVVS